MITYFFIPSVAYTGVFFYGCINTFNNQRNNKNQNKLKPIYITQSLGKVLV